MKKLILTAFVLSSFVISVSGQTIPWPFAPTNEAHPLGNNYMEYQNYGGSPYYHDGIDMMSGAGGVPVYSAADGVVTHISTGTMYGGIMIGNPVPGGEGWLYWHIPSSSMTVSVGDSVYTGDFIGSVATWSVAEFHHVHFNKVVGTGGYPWSWYSSTDNPLNYLDPNTDDDIPFFEDAIPGQKFAFAVNNTSNYLNPNNLSGQVDIIAHIGDKIGHRQWDLNPHEIWYWIEGPLSTDPVCSFIASGWCPGDNTILVPYQDDNTCNTQGDYNNREYFFNLTDSDGDSIVELSDNNFAWNVDFFPSGDYWIMVEAKDRFGNSTLDSMMVNLAGTGVDISITLTPENPPIIIPATGGSFEFTIEITNNGNTGIDYDGWLMAVLPDSSVFGPTLLRTGLFLPSGGSLVRTMNQNVPANAPAGEYYFYGVVGNYPGVSLDENGFNFTKE